MVCKNKVIAAVLAMCIFMGTFVGCAPFDDSKDDNTLTINMWASAVPQIMGALRANFPDINFVVNEYSGGNTSLYHKELLRRDECGDLFFYTTFYNDSDAPKYLVDLSGYPFLANYDRAILSTLDVGGAIYQIPGPITVRYIAVNKTLFEEKGWKIPENFEEFTAVCKQIRREEPDITPLALGMEGMGFVWSLVTSYAQMGFLDTAEGRMAEQGYRYGTASFGEAFGEGLDMVGQLVDAGAFMPDKYRHIWNISPEQMGNREVAMCYVMNPSEDHTRLFSGQAKGDEKFGKYNNDEFVTLPFYGKNPKNKGLILGTTNTWGISKKLENKGNEKKLENALRVLEYISSEEGQLAIRSDTSSIPAIRDLHADDIPEFMRNLWNDSTNSIKSFFLYTGYEHMIIETGQVLTEAMSKGSSQGMKDEFIRIADKLNNEFLRKQASSAAFGYAKDDLSVEQTRKICCDAFRETAKTDIALASESGIKNGIFNKNGLSGRLFKGDIVSDSINVVIAATVANVVSVSVTGNDIWDMLEKGKLMSNDKGESENFAYWSSGIDVSRKKGKITDIKLKGTAIDKSATYNVAMLKGDYSEEFENSHVISDTGVIITDALATYFKSCGVISPERQ